MPFGSIVRSIANLSLWRGALVNALVDKRVDAYVGSAGGGLLKTIKRVQAGYSSLTVTIGVTSEVVLPIAVTPSKCVVVFQWVRLPNEGALAWSIGVTEATKLTFAATYTPGSSGGSTSIVRCEWQVVEFY